MPPTAPPKAAPLGWRPFFQLRPSPPRTVIALRAALAMGAPVVAGSLAGDISAGLLATIGAFTVLYGPDRPYLNRAVLLATIAIAFTIVVVIGLLTHPHPVLAIATVVLISGVATFLCNALRTGPPGAYLFALACAATTAIPSEHLALWQVAALVLSGGAFAWCTQMAGALIDRHGPERTAVINAASAVTRFANTIGTPAEDEVRHVTAMTLHSTWTALVTFQPHRLKPDGTLETLRAITRDLHLLFVDGINAGRNGSSLAHVSDRAKALADEARRGHLRDTTQHTGNLPLGHFGIGDSLRENLTFNSPAVLTAVRVAIATALAGAAGAMLDLERAYWTMAAAVLMLHQGLDWTRALQRGLERMGGTLAGLIVAGAVLIARPAGLALALTLAALQFLIETLVLRNYALSVVFITAAALVIASGGEPVTDVGHLLWVRTIDTIVGCVTGLIVHLLTAPRTLEVPIPRRIAETLAAAGDVLDFVADRDVTSLAAKGARRSLQVRATALIAAYESGIGATANDRRFAERLWPAVAVTQRLAYHTLAACWSIEEAGGHVKDAAIAAFDEQQLAVARRALASLSRTVRGGKPQPLPALPALIATDLTGLHHSLVQSES